MNRPSPRSRWLIVLFCLVVAISPGASASPPQEPVQQEHTATAEPATHEQGGGGSHGHSPVYRWINLAILVGGLGFVLRKPLAQFFAERTASIQRSLEEGRSALAAAEEKLHAVEQKLEGVEKEMAAFRAAALREMEEEHARLRRTTEQEGEKMMESVRVQMDVASKQARLELRLYAAEQAVEMAEQVVAGRMDAERQKRLVSQFAEKLGAEQRRS